MLTRRCILETGKKLLVQNTTRATIYMQVLNCSEADALVGKIYKQPLDT
jgi:hypothetical protein